MRYLGFKKAIGRFRLLGYYITGNPNYVSKLNYADKTQYALSHIKVKPDVV